MSDVWQISSASGKTEHVSAAMAFEEMDRLVRAGSSGVTFEKKPGSKKGPAARPTGLIAVEEDGQTSMGI